MKRLKKSITIAIALLYIVGVGAPVFAAIEDEKNPLNLLQNVGQNVPAYKDSAVPGDEGQIFSQIGAVVAVFFSILGIFFVILFIYGGFIWMNSRGNEDEVNRSKNILRAAVIGLIITLLAFAISNFIFSSIINASELSA
ncbi:MAG: hypothetical protein COT81_04400 [Candidatus Buchananbacteria bacterium CG10_big_fil_rev_8_21_14_0_10_42_9]|uniref:Uncharacterized protein n=1 Tax=Candidatus Buchananbacteria bacterium CG10_big_fil_rev_8_21_14_0_10_42_9 TaxID=1974526 RepID=A0A2H0W0N5_9BACT|nr:MAG: hypothetical protein COT81_04400 [Candidatus Buchananbacteria bacterium CG10_big_fil_rev_8_21_14_0_10_42_9]